VFVVVDVWCICLLFENWWLLKYFHCVLVLCCCLNYLYSGFMVFIIL
jgi:hypothetical protein